MKACAYLKKNIDWSKVPVSSSVFSKIRENLGFFRNRLKTNCFDNWEDCGLDIVSNDNTDMTNRVFHSNETFKFAVDNYDWIIPMDDDDNLYLKLPIIEKIQNETKPDIIVWDCYEYDFITGIYRIDHRISIDDIPSQMRGRIRPILPGSFAISSAFAKRILDKNLVGQAVSFQTAMDLFADLGAKVKFLDEVWCSRPYTHFCEYYIGNERALDTKSNYNFDKKFFTSIDDIYNQIRRAQQ